MSESLAERIEKWLGQKVLDNNELGLLYEVRALENRNAELEAYISEVEAEEDRQTESSIERLHKTAEKHLDMTKECDELKEALIITRGQWIHSVNAEQCLRALGEKAMATPREETQHDTAERLKLRNMLGNEVISYAQAQFELTPLEEALLNTLLNQRIRN